MRQLSDATRVRAFMRALGRRARVSGRVYLAGGASAILLHWRATTVDIDLELDPSLDALLRDIAELKESLEVNVELASPSHFIPEVPGWRERSAFITQEGPLSFHHYDFYAQALAKIERGHTRDRDDLAAMVSSGLVEPDRLMTFFERIEPELYRYPALDPKAFRAAVADAVRGLRR